MGKPHTSPPIALPWSGALLCNTANLYYICHMKATYLIRVTDELKAALLAAGPDHVRNTLAAAYCNTEPVIQPERITRVRNTGKRNTRTVLQPTAEPVLQADVLQPIVIQDEQETVIQPVLQRAEPVIQKEGPTGDRFALMRAEAERKRAAKKAAIEALPPAVRGLVS